MTPGTAPSTGDSAGDAAAAVRRELVTVVHSSRLEGESIALCIRTASRAGADPRVRVGRGREAWQPSGGAVVVLDHAAAGAVQAVASAVATLVRQGSQVVLLTRDPRDPIAEAARHAGASSVLTEGGSADGIVSAVDHCLLGRDSRATSLGEAGAVPSEVKAQHLTGRELAVIELLLSAEEPSAALVAAELGISVNTVKVHLANVRRRLGDVDARNRIALRGALEQRGWIEVR